MNSLKAIIIAGPNGSGKTTLTEALPKHGIVLPRQYINPDNIANRLQEEKPEAPRREIDLEAFHQARTLRVEYRETRVSFYLETVFSHPSGLLDIEKLRDAGYEVTLVVVTTSNPEINVRRVTERVRTGRQHVEAAKVRDRYWRFMRLLPRIIWF